MTPLFHKVIQLLQLSTLEFELVVRKELEEKPLFEELPEEGPEVDGEAPRQPRPWRAIFGSLTTSRDDKRGPPKKVGRSPKKRCRVVE